MANHPQQQQTAPAPVLAPKPSRFEVSLGGMKVRVPRCPSCRSLQPISLTGRREPTEKLTCPDCKHGYTRGEEDAVMQPSIVVEATSQGDAIEIFRAYNGITGTSQKFDVQPVA